MRHLSNFGDCLARVGGFSNRVTRALQRQSQDATQAFFVFDEKDVRHEVEPPGGSGRLAGAPWAEFIIDCDARSVKQKNLLKIICYSKFVVTIPEVRPQPTCQLIK